MNIYGCLMILRRLLPFFWVKEEKLYIRFLLSICLIFISIIATVATPIIFRQIVNLLPYQKEKLSTSILLLLISYGFIWMLSHMLYQIRQIMLLRPLARGLSLISLRLFHHLHLLPIQFHLKKKSGAISSIITKIQEGMPNFLGSLLFYMLPTVLEICMSIIIIWYYYGSLYGSILIIIIASSFFITLYFADKAAHYQCESNDSFFYANAHMVDSLSNFMSVKYFGSNDLESSNYKRVLLKSEDSFVKFYTLMEMIQLLQVTVIGVGIITLTLITGIKSAIGIYDIGDFVMINGYILQFAIPLKFLSYNIQSIKKGLADLKEIFSILDLKEGVVNDSNSLDIKMIEKIQFKDVFFSYSNNLALENINLEIFKGQRIAIVGSTGSSKSTLINLLFRLYEATKGEILFNGINIKDLKFHDINKLISIIPQDTTLFNTSIYKNILYANQDATNEELNQVVEAAGLKEFIQKLKDKGDTVVGKSGLRLSGGERQRVAIARGLIKKASLYVLDEATSCLDATTEMQVLDKVISLKKGATLLIVAHRLSAISKNIDTIFVFDNGQIVERGSHAELIAKRGKYYDFWSKQVV